MGDAGEQRVGGHIGAGVEMGRCTPTWVHGCICCVSICLKHMGLAATSCLGRGGIWG